MTDQMTSTGSTVMSPPAKDGRRLRVEGRVVALGVILLALLCVPFLYPVLVPYAYVLQVMTMAFMWIAMASSWNIIGGFTGYISLGHNVFLAVGGYFAGYLAVYAGLSPFVTAIGAGLVCVALGAVIGMITLRTSGDAFIIATIALMLVARIALDNWDLLGGTNGLSLPPLVLSDRGLLNVPFYYAMLIVAIITVYACFRIKHSKFGLGLRAIAEDESKAEVSGINTNAYKIAAFALSGFFIGVVGAIWGYSLAYLRPEIFLTLAVAADMVLMSILGGRGTIAGPVIGAVIIVAFNEFAVAKLGGSEINLAVTGVLLIAVLLAFPAGIVGSLRERGKLPRILDWD
jgi:branched-chain amino acid transport system permease protein